MILNISEATADAMLDTVARLLDGGSVELLTSDSELLVVLQLSSPTAGPAVDGELQLDKIYDGTAVLSGQAKFVRVVAADGNEVFSGDVGNMDSDALIRLTTVQFHAGGPVRLNSFRLVLP